MPFDLEMKEKVDKELEKELKRIEFVYPVLITEVAKVLRYIIAYGGGISGAVGVLHLLFNK